MSDALKQTVLDLLAKHFLSLNWIDDSEANKGVHHRSAFLADVGGCWLLVTAGHGLESIDEAIEGGYELPTVNLADGYGREAASKQAIIFDYKHANRVWVHDRQAGYDFGIIELRPYYQMSIEQNRGAEPLTCEAWMVNPDQEATGYYLVGVADEAISEPPVDTEGSVPINLRLVGYPIQRIEPPNTALRRNREMFYGRLVDDPSQPPPISDIVGMSGAPIFAVKQDEPGKVRYWLVALQSYWDPHTREIRGSLTAPVLAKLEETAAEFLEKRNSVCGEDN